MHNNRKRWTSKEDKSKNKNRKSQVLTLNKRVIYWPWQQNPPTRVMCSAKKKEEKERTILIMKLVNIFKERERKVAKGKSV